MMQAGRILVVVHGHKNLLDAAAGDGGAGATALPFEVAKALSLTSCPVGVSAGNKTKPSRAR